MANLSACLSTGKDDWETPDDIFDPWNEVFHFDLDAAANEVNHKCDKWLGPGGLAEDALTVEWKDYTTGPVWLNPPYSRGLQSKFVKKAAESGLDVVCLLPARTDTKLFHEIIQPSPNTLHFLKGRIKFKGAQHGAPFPSMIVVFQGTYGLCHEPI